MTSRGALPPFSVEECIHGSSAAPLKALAALPPSHVLASSVDGNLSLYGPSDGLLQSELVYDPPPTKRPIDRLVVLHGVGRAIVLSEGALSFHGLPNMELLSAGAAGGAVNMSHLVRGVSVFAVDDPSKTSVRMAIAKRKSIAFYLVTSGSIDAVKELPLPDYVYVAVFRRNAVCVADRQEYSIIDIIAGDRIPLMPISQEKPVEGGQAQSLAAPSIVAVGANEFLMASHTDTGSLGLFVRHSGEPCRGTITWSSRVRSLAIEGAQIDKPSVDSGFVLALLRNNTIEVHSLADTARITQIISLQPEIIKDPRSLLSLTDQGLDFSGVSQSALGGSLDHVKIPLFTASTSKSEVPSTPPMRPRRASSVRSVRARKQLAPAHTLLLCKQAFYAIQPLTLLVRAEALLGSSKISEAVALADASPRGELVRYIYFRAALLYLAETKFEEAGECFVQAMRRREGESQKSLVLDPRIILRMWPDLRSGLNTKEDPTDETLDMWRGAEEAMRDVEISISSLVLTDLYRNYSPHVKPDIESAPATVELRNQLMGAARSMTMRVLQEWRMERERGSVGSRKLDKVIDTSLAKMLVEQGDVDSMLALLLVEPSNVNVEDLVEWLREQQCTVALARVLTAKGRVAEALPVWIKLYDSTLPPHQPVVTLSEVEDMLATVEDAAIQKQYGLWFLSRHRSTGLRILGSLPMDTIEAVRLLLDEVRQTDASAADELVENFILLKKMTDGDMQTATILRYLDLVKSATTQDKASLSSFESDFIASGPAPEPFLVVLMRQSPSLPVLERRLRLILFLQRSSSYDAQQVRQLVENMPAMSYERVLVYGRLKLHRQALAILTLTLGDMLSAEAYCSNRGSPISRSDTVKLAEHLGLPIAPTKPSRRPGYTKTLDPERRELVQMLVDLCLQHRGSDTLITQEATIQLISKQAMHLNLQDILNRVPDEWTAHDLEPFCTRALRRSIAEQYDLQIMKALAAGYNLQISDDLFTLQAAMGPKRQDVDSGAARPENASMPEEAAQKVASIVADKLEKANVYNVL